jgi:AcrR family transcriptional regulator
MNANLHSHNADAKESQGAKPAQQERSRKNRDNIVDAFEELLKEKPFEKISVNDIAARADVAVGTLYRRFKNKDALIPVVFDLYKNRAEQWTTGEGRIEPADDATLRDVIELIVKGAWTILTREAHILRAVHILARTKPEIIGDDEYWERMEDMAYQSFQPLMQAFPKEVKRDDIDVAARMMTYFINAFFLERGLYGDESPAKGLKLSDESFLTETTDMLYGYLNTASQ